MMLSTRVGEIRRVSLSDGSKVTLDTATSVEVEIGQAGRRASVKAGRARFDVAKDKRPFVIEAGSSVATAQDAVLDIEEFGSKARVDVLAGTATIAKSGARGAEMSLGAGETMTAISGRTVASHSLGAAPDWTRGMLEFDATPLGAAVELANRYSTSKILLSGDLEGLRVSGAFRAGDTKGLAEALADALHLRITRTSNGSLVLSRSVEAK
jgi:transmembrane sensor